MTGSIPALYKRIFLLCAVIAVISFQSCSLEPPVTLTVRPDFGGYILRASNEPGNAALDSAIAHTRAALQTSGERFAPLFGEIFQKENPDYHLANLFVHENDNAYSATQANAAIVNDLNNRGNFALKNTIDNITVRLSKVARDVTINYDWEKEIITVTFTGSRYLAQVRACISTVGDLRFFDAYSNAEAFPYIQKINARLAEMCNTDSAQGHAAKQAARQQGHTPAKEDTGSLGSYMSQEQQANSKYPLFAVMTPNLSNQQELAQGPAVGHVMLKDTAKLSQYLSNGQVRGLLPPGSRFLFGQAFAPGSPIPVYLVKIPVAGSVPDGTNITSARADFSPVGKNLPVLMLDMNVRGAKLWHIMTERNIGKYIAIAIDDQVSSCPRVDNTISSGSTEISNGFTIEESVALAAILTAGKLPVALTIISSSIKE